MVPSSIGIASSGIVTVLEYCSGRGFQAPARAALERAAGAALPAFFALALVPCSAAFLAGAFVVVVVVVELERASLTPWLTTATAATVPAVRVRMATEAAVSRVSVRRIEWVLPECRASCLDGATRAHDAKLRNRSNSGSRSSSLSRCGHPRGDALRLGRLDDRSEVEQGSGLVDVHIGLRLVGLTRALRLLGLRSLLGLRLSSGVRLLGNVLGGCLGLGRRGLLGLLGLRS